MCDQLTQGERARMKQASGLRLRGWPLVGWCAAAVMAVSVVELAVRGVGEDGLRLVIRTTAKTSLLFFSAAFVAAALARGWPHPVSRWLSRQRRYLGVSFAASHLVH